MWVFIHLVKFGYQVATFMKIAAYLACNMFSICVYQYQTYWLFSPRFFGGGTLGLIAPVPGHCLHLSRFMGKPSMWFLNRSNTNQAVQSQKQARSLKFQI